MNQNEAGYGGVDETIGQVERLYRALTGAAVPQGDAPYAPIPAEKDPMQHVEEQVSRLIEVLGQVGARTGPAAAWAPAICVWENESEILVTIDIPGLKRDQVEIVVQGNAVTVSGVRASRDGLRLRSCEAPLGAFRRTLIVPAVRGGEPAAQMKDGVLEIRIPKADAETVVPRNVPIH